MSSDYFLQGRDTLEVLHLGTGRGDCWVNWRLEDFSGPALLLNLLNERLESKVVYIYPEHLHLLYSRLAAENPSGLEIEKKSWPGVARTSGGREVSGGEEPGCKADIVVNLTSTDEDDGYPHLRKYLPELFDERVTKRMATDPWLDVHLLGKALEEKIVVQNESFSPRWAPEWRIHCEKFSLN